MFKHLHKYLLQSVLLAAVLLCSLPSYAQKPHAQAAQPQSSLENKIQDSILGLLHHIDVVKKEDSLKMANDELMAYLKRVCTKVPATLNMKYKKVETEMDITSSDDNKVRVYSWKSSFEGTYYNILMQYKGSKNPIVWQMNNADDPLSSSTVPTSIKSIQTAGKKTVYIVVEGVFGSHGLETEKAVAYTITNDQMLAIPLFQTETGTEKEVSYHIASINDYDPEINIHLSPDKKTLYIPVSGKEYSVYKFNGTKFVYDKNAK
ncbi:MAG: hypothetical protein WCG87_05865 [Bacteroidota bacterium]